MKQKNVCWCVLCVSILTFPTGAGVNKGLQPQQVWGAEFLQALAAVRPCWRSQYLLFVSKHVLFLVSKPRLYRGRPVYDPGNSCSSVLMLLFVYEIYLHSPWITVSVWDQINLYILKRKCVVSAA